MRGLIDRVLDYLAERASKPACVIRQVNGSVAKTAGRYTGLTAPSVDGYTFVCWICCVPGGWTGVITPTNAYTQTVNFFVQYSASPSTSNGNVSAFALYHIA